MIRLYVIPVEIHEALGVNVAAICWGSCGKGLPGGIGLDSYGSAIPCATPAAECPCFEREGPEPLGTSEWNGREYELVLRKLRTATVQPARTPPSAPRPQLSEASEG